jgi:hypothetical protein
MKMINTGPGLDAPHNPDNQNEMKRSEETRADGKMEQEHVSSPKMHAVTNVEVKGVATVTPKDINLEKVRTGGEHGLAKEPEMEQKVVTLAEALNLFPNKDNSAWKLVPRGGKKRGDVPTSTVAVKNHYEMLEIIGFADDDSKVPNQIDESIIPTKRTARGKAQGSKKKSSAIMNNSEEADIDSIIDSIEKADKEKSDKKRSSAESSLKKKSSPKKRRVSSHKCRPLSQEHAQHRSMCSKSEKGLPVKSMFPRSNMLQYGKTTSEEAKQSMEIETINFANLSSSLFDEKDVMTLKSHFEKDYDYNRPGCYHQFKCVSPGECHPKNYLRKQFHKIIIGTVQEEIDVRVGYFMATFMDQYDTYPSEREVEMVVKAAVSEHA